MKEVQEDRFNSYCIHPECFSTRNSFFNYSPNSILENLHIFRHHRTEFLDASIFSKAKPSTEDSTGNNQKHFLLEMISQHFHSFYRKTISLLQSKYQDIFLALNEKPIKEFSQERMNVLNRLQQGDYQMLAVIMKWDQAIAQEIQSIYNNFYNLTISKLTKKLQKIKKQEAAQDLTASTHKETNPPGESYSSLANTPQKRTSHYMEQPKTILSCKIPSDSEELQIQDNKSTARSSFTLKKTKQIQKVGQQSTNFSKKKVSKAYRKFKLIDVNGEIKSMGTGRRQIRINSCQNPELTLSILSNIYGQNVKELTKIHIFHHNFATKGILTRLLQGFPNIRVITLNCPHQFNSTHLQQLINPENEKKVVKLELKWDIDKFFTDYHVLKYFPTKIKYYFQNRKNQLNIFKMLLKVPKTPTLVINTLQHISALLQCNQFDFDAVRTLHYSKLQQTSTNSIIQIPHFSNLFNLGKFRNLKALNLQRINLNEATSKFYQFLKQNNQISTLHIGYCELDEINCEKIFILLKQLPQLSQFSFQNNRQPFVVDLEPLFWLVELKQLHLKKILFKGRNPLKGIRALRKLTHLSLSNCHHIQSNFLEQLHKPTFQNLVFLNIGYTQIETKFSRLIPLMTSLQYLNIDSAKLKGDDFLKGFQQYVQLHRHVSPLKYLSIDGMEVDRKQMGLLSRYAPRLRYLSVSKCKDLCKESFQQHKALRNLVIDKQQGEILPELAPHVQVYVRE